MGFQPVQLRVSGIVQEAPDVKTFRLGSDSDLPFEFLSGQFIVLFFEIFDEAKGRIRRKSRAFSISSSPIHKDYIEVTVRKTGFVSSFMHEVLKVGDQVTVKSLSGDFNFQEGLADELVLLAGGTGIAPLMSMIRYIIDRRLAIPVTLIYSSRTPEDIIFREELEVISSRHPNLRCVNTITRPEGTAWEGPTGRINRSLLGPDTLNRQALFYLCGPQAMIEAGVELLKEVGVDQSRIRLEKWD